MNCERIWNEKCVQSGNRTDKLRSSTCRPPLDRLGPRRKEIRAQTGWDFSSLKCITALCLGLCWFWLVVRSQTVRTWRTFCLPISYNVMQVHFGNCRFVAVWLRSTMNNIQHTQTHTQYCSKIFSMFILGIACGAEVSLKFRLSIEFWMSSCRDMGTLTRN